MTPNELTKKGSAKTLIFASSKRVKTKFSPPPVHSFPPRGKSIAEASMTPKFPTKKSTGENPYFCMVKLSENRISNNIPFAKLEMIKKLIFVKSRFSVDFFVVSNTVIPREKSLDLICFFFLKTLFFQENRKTF